MIHVNHAALTIRCSSHDAHVHRGRLQDVLSISSCRNWTHSESRWCWVPTRRETSVLEHRHQERESGTDGDRHLPSANTIRA